jgi:ribosome silencing factor RsfS/YbeB/iojap
VTAKSGRNLPPFGDRRHGRVGLLGGSFNPAHEGHLHLSREALKRLKLDQVWWLVSPQNPLKSGREMASLGRRLDGARRTAAHPDILVTDVERRLGTTRTARSLAGLTRRYPNLSFVWLMGADNLAQMPQWWPWPVLPRAVLARPASAHCGGMGRRPGPISRCGVTRLRPPPSAHNTKETTIPKTQDASGSTPPDLDSMVGAILASLDDDKAQDILTIDLVGKTSIADRMIIASGTSARQVSAMAEHLVQKLRELGIRAQTEGEKHGDWVLIDAGDVVVHLFRPEVRAFYQIERIWSSPAPSKKSPKRA